MPKSAVVVLAAGIIILAIGSLFMFHITDSFLPPAQPEPTKKMNNKIPDATELKIEDIKKGTGPEVKSGDTISINYKGTLTDGTQFDSSYDRGEPFETQIGVGKVIKGWDEGVIGMKVGGKRRLIIPPELGYGSQDMGTIPPNSTLIFEVELMAIK